MELKKRKTRQKLLFPALACYTLSLALLLGTITGYSVFAEGGYLVQPFLHLLLLLCHGLFFGGLFRPHERRKLLVWAVAAICIIQWLDYWAQVGDFLYALMSFPIELFPDVLLIALLLSPRRGKTLRIVTICIQGLAVAESLWEILAKDSTFVPSGDRVYWYLGFAVVLLRYAVIVLLALGLPSEDRKARQMPYLADLDRLTEAEQERLFTLCPSCAEENTYGSVRCAACGEEITHKLPDLSLLPKSGPVAENLELLLKKKQYENLEELQEKPLRLEMEPAWQRAVDAAEGEVKQTMIRLRRVCFNLAEQQRLDKRYDEAKALQQADAAADRLEAARLFRRIAAHRDAAAQAYESLRLARDAVYNEAQQAEAEGHYTEAKRLYACIPGWQEADARQAACAEHILEENSALYGISRGKKVLVSALSLALLLLSALAYAF